MNDGFVQGGLRMHRGRFYKLVHPVGRIPAGIYRLERVSNDGLTFSVGRERRIIFHLNHLKRDLLSEVSYSVGRLFATGDREFELACLPRI
jgi:hypothetical protein